MKNRSVIYSVQAALRGLVYAYTHERNLRTEIWVAVVAIATFFLLRGSVQEFEMLLMWIVLVLFAEISNTAIERTVDILKPHKHPYARVIKDLSAAFVLLVCVGAGIGGILIFVPLIVQFV